MTDTGDTETQIRYAKIRSGIGCTIFVIPFLWSVNPSVSRCEIGFERLQNEIIRNYRYKPFFHQYYGKTYTMFRAYPMFVRVKNNELERFKTSLYQYYNILQTTEYRFDIKKMSELIEKIYDKKELVNID